MSEFNQRAYELFAQPLVQAMSQRGHARSCARQFHPLRVQRWAFSDLNPVARLARARRREAVKAQRQAGRRRTTPRARSRSATSEADQRVARLLPRDARRDERGGVLPDLRQRVLALPRRQARGRGAARHERGRAARAAVRQGGARVDRGRRLCRGARARRRRCSRGRASRCRCARLAAEAGARRRVPRPAARRCRPTSGAASAASRRSSSATSPRRRSRRCRSCSRSRGDRERLVDARPTPARRRARAARRAVDRAARDAREHRRDARRRAGTAAARRRGDAAPQAAASAAAKQRGATAQATETRMERKHEKYQRLLDVCKTLPPTPTAVAHPCDESSLRGAVDAAKLGLIAPILVGPAARIEAVAKQHGIDIARLPIVDAPHSQASAEKAVELVREGKAEALMKGSLHTDELMGAVVRRDTGLRTARRVSHCFVMDVPTLPGDADHHRRRGQHRADAGGQGRHRAERDRPRARAAASRRCAWRSCRRWRRSTRRCRRRSRRPRCARWPTAARSPARSSTARSRSTTRSASKSAQIKKIDSPVAGRANVLVVPDLEAGNMLAKSLSFLAGADAAGIVLGARVPIILTSRADSRDRRGSPRARSRRWSRNARRAKRRARRSA